MGVKLKGLETQKVLISIETTRKCADPQKTLRDGRKCIQPRVRQKKVLQWNLQEPKKGSGPFECSLAMNQWRLSCFVCPLPAVRCILRNFVVPNPPCPLVMNG